MVIPNPVEVRVKDGFGSREEAREDPIRIEKTIAKNGILVL